MLRRPDEPVPVPYGYRHAWSVWTFNALGTFVTVLILLLAESTPSSRTGTFGALWTMWSVTVYLWPGHTGRSKMALLTVITLVIELWLAGLLTGIDVNVFMVTLAATTLSVVSIGLIYAFSGPLTRDLRSQVDLLVLFGASTIGSLAATPLWVQADILGTAHGLDAFIRATLPLAGGVFTGALCSAVFWFRPALPDIARTNWAEFSLMLVVGGGTMMIIFGIADPVWTWAILIPAIWVGTRLPPWPTAIFVVLTGMYGSAAQFIFGIERASQVGTMLVVFGGAIAFALVAMTLSLLLEQRRLLLEQMDHERRLAADQAEILRLTFESMSEGVVVIDSEIGVESYNGGASRLLGRQFLATPVSEWPHYDEVDRQPLYEGVTLTGTREFVTPEGEVRTLAMQVNGLNTNSGHRKSVLVVRDITSEQQRLNELSDFAAVAAHDLRTPLTGLRGWLELSEASLQDGDLEGASEALSRGISSTVKMGHQLDGWVAYNVARAGVMAEEVVDLSAMAEQVSVLYVDADVSVGRITPVRGDGALVMQLLQNLIGNAIKYGRDGVGVELSITGRHLPDGWVEVTVEDNGIGVPAGMEETIFERFTRAENGRQRQGTGMGLSLCKQIVQRHGGDIWVQPSPAPGSIFKFTLPAA